MQAAWKRSRAKGQRFAPLPYDDDEEEFPVVPMGPEFVPSESTESSSYSCLWTPLWRLWTWRSRRRKAQLEKRIDTVYNIGQKLSVKIDDAENKLHALKDVLDAKVRVNDRQGARRTLISVKRLQKQIEAFHAYKSDLDMLHESLSQTEDQKQFIEEMRVANKVLKQTKMTKAIDTVENVIDDLEDHRQAMSEFHDTLTTRSDAESSQIDEELDNLFAPAQAPTPTPTPSTPIASKRAARELDRQLPHPPKHAAALETLRELDELTSA